MTRFVAGCEVHALPPCVATIGFFDGVHLGHRHLIEQVCEAARVRNLASALITFRSHPRQVLHPESPICLLSTPQEKAEALASTGVDWCVTLDFTPELAGMPAKRFMDEVLRQRIGVRTLVIGYDHRFGYGRADSFDDYVRFGRDMGMEVLRANELQKEGVHVSSSTIRRLLLQGEVAEAAQALGCMYSLEGVVVRGRQVGRTIGFPTANLQPVCPEKLVPADGVYAVRVQLENETYGGMLDIGLRPTFDNGNDRSIEVHLLDFLGDLYGRVVRVDFVRRIRANVQFDSPASLVAQLQKDETVVRQVLTQNGH